MYAGKPLRLGRKRERPGVVATGVGGRCLPRRDRHRELEDAVHGAPELERAPFWKVSHLKKSSTVAPSILSVSSDIMSSIEDVCTGVSFKEKAATRCSAIRTSFSEAYDRLRLGFLALFGDLHAQRRRSDPCPRTYHCACPSSDVD